MDRDNLTPEEKSISDRIYDKWIKIACSIEPINRRDVVVALANVYRESNLKPPRLILWAGCPLTERMLAALVETSNSIEKLLERVDVSGYYAVIKDELSAKEIQIANKYTYSSNDINFCFKLDFSIETTKSADISNKQIFRLELAKIVPSYQPFEEVCVVRERASFYSRNENNLLHNTNGPAAIWPNGCKMYAINGVSIEERFVMNPETITLYDIVKEKNKDVREILIDRYGREKLQAEVGDIEEYLRD